MPVPSQRHIQPSRFFCAEPRRGSQIEGGCLGAGDFVCLEKTPCTLNASVQTYPAILTQKDDGKAPGIRANRRQKNRLRGKASASFERGCVVILLKGVLSR
jgi:hypothetical protein